MKKNNKGPIYTLPLSLWITIFFVIPTFFILAISLMKKGLYSGVEPKLAFDAYLNMFNKNYVDIIVRTVIMSIEITIITILFALPAAYYMARSKYKNFLMILVIIPFWTNLLIRIHAFKTLLASNGIVNQFLQSIGVIGLLKSIGIIDTDYIRFLYSEFAIILVTVYAYLPYAILPLFSTIEKFDFSLLEAARDLGASKSQAIFKVMIPNIKAGMITATLFVFIPALGSYLIPDLVGDSSSYMIGNVIADQLLKARNWPMASSLSIALTFVTTIGVLIFVSTNQSKTEAMRQEKMNNIGS